MAKVFLLFSGLLGFALSAKAQIDSTINISDTTKKAQETRRLDSVVQAPQALPDAPVIINTNGKIINKTTNIIIRGDWTNNGDYTEDVTVQNNNWLYIHKVDFGGTNQNIGGTSSTKFLQLDVWGSLTLQQNITIDLANYNYGNLIVHGRGIIDPEL